MVFLFNLSTISHAHAGSLRKDGGAYPAKCRSENVNYIRSGTKLSLLLQGFVPSLKEVTTVDNLLQPRAVNLQPNVKSEDPAFIQYTSGSTSDPKGVLLTHHNLLTIFATYGKAVQVTENDVVVSWLPLYHDFG